MEKINYYVNDTKSPGVVLSVATDKGKLKSGELISYAVVRIKGDNRPPVDIMLGHNAMASLCEQLIISLYGYSTAEAFEKLVTK